MREEAICVKVGTINEARNVNELIPEFENDYIDDRCKGVLNKVFIAYINNKAVGYLIAYDRYGESSIYCWMLGVVPKYRKRGVLHSLMHKFENWAQSQNIKAIFIKTRRFRSVMFSFLQRNNFSIISVTKKPDSTQDRILLKKTL